MNSYKPHTAPYTKLELYSKIKRPGRWTPRIRAAESHTEGTDEPGGCLYAHDLSMLSPMVNVVNDTHVPSNCLDQDYRIIRMSRIEEYPENPKIL